MTELDTLMDKYYPGLSRGIYERKAYYNQDLNKNILDKLDLLIGTSEVVKNEFSDYTTEEQNSTLNNLISNLEEYKNEKNNYISNIKLRL